jgi:tetratricopeptide (TPR) repeat protein
MLHKKTTIYRQIILAVLAAALSKMLIFRNLFSLISPVVMSFINFSSLLLGIILLIFSGFISPLKAQTSTYAVYQAVQKQSQAAFAKQDYRTAIATTEKFIQTHPRYSLAYLEQSAYAIKNRDVVLLKRNLVALKKQQVDLPLDLILTGAQLAEKKRLYQMGLDILAQATPAQAQAEALLLQRARFQQKLNQPALALKTLQLAYERKPNSPKILQELAAAYQSVNRRRSIELYMQLLKHEGYKDLSLTALGLLYTRLYQADPSANNRSNLAQAKSYYEQYLLRHPSDQTIKNLLTQLKGLLEG